MGNLIDKVGAAVVIYMIVLIFIFLTWFLSLLATILMQGYTKKMTKQFTYLNETIKNQNIMINNLQNQLNYIINIMNKTNK